MIRYAYVQTYLRPSQKNSYHVPCLRNNCYYYCYLDKKIRLYTDEEYDDFYISKNAWESFSEHRIYGM